MEQLPFPPAGDDVLAMAPRYGELQDRQPVARVRTAAGDPAWLVTRHQDVAALLADNRLGRSHPDPARAARISTSVLTGVPAGRHESERERHRLQRRLLAPAFSARRISGLRARIGELVDRLLGELPAPPADWHQVFSVPLPVLVICELLGVPYGDHPRFRRWAADLTSLTDPARAAAARRDLVGYVHGLIPRKREAPGDDVLSDLVTAAGEHGLTDTGIARLAAMLLFAGHETTVVRLDLGLLLLLTHPQQLAGLRARPSLVPAAVEEILRLSSLSTTGGLPRYAAADITAGDALIRAGDAVILAVQAANRDPRVFREPAAFDITRTPNPHLSFGQGPRYCIGASLARAELQEAFSRIPARLPGLRLAVPPGDLRARGDLLTGGLAGLPVTW